VSIVTKTGDKGTTSLMYGKRVPKSHPRIEACGAVDELNAALGTARTSSIHEFVGNNLLTIQKSLVNLMGELATAAEDRDRYVKDGYALITPAITGTLETLIREIESQNVSLKGWATPGANQSAATLDVARTVCRRAERRVCELQESGDLQNPEILIYLNRLADLLWLFARWVETNMAPEEK
jgi:cob(I)alamin adenosyltransferase